MSLIVRQDVSMVSDVVTLTQELIQIDTSNYGDSYETVGEAAAADYCAQRLREAGWDPEVIVTSSDSRRAVALRITHSRPPRRGASCCFRVEQASLWRSD